MTQPIWITPSGSLGVIQESLVYLNSVEATDADPLTYTVIAGVLPPGLQFLNTGEIIGVPFSVNQDTTSRFTVRAKTTVTPYRLADRTFSITITGNIGKGTADIWFFI